MDMRILLWLLSVSSCLWSFIDSSANRHCKLRFKPDRGYCISPDVCPGASLSSLCLKADHHRCCLLEPTPAYPDILTNFTFEIFTRIFNNTSRSRHLYKPFIHSLHDAGIQSCPQQAAFSALVAFDTEYLRNMEEIPQEVANKKLESTYWTYIGRGIFHIPGKQYYHWINKTLGINVLDHPELLAFPSLAFRAAAAVWNYSYTNIPKTKAPKFNNLVDGSRYSFQLLRYYISGHLSGMDKLLNLWDKISKILKCDCNSSEGRTCTVDGKHGKCKMINDCRGSQVYTSNQCPGPPSAAQCCLACSSSTEIYIVKDNTLHQSTWLSTIVEMFSQDISLSTRHVKVINFGKPATKEFLDKGRLTHISRIIQRSNITDAISYIRQDIRTVTGASRRTAVVVITENTTHINTVPSELRGTSNSIMVKFVTLIPTKNKMLSINYFTSKQKFHYGISDKVYHLMECVCSGPWETQSQQQMSFILQRGEKIYLGLNVQTKSNNLGIVVNNIVGKAFVNGIPTIKYLPGQHSDRCLHHEINAELDINLPFAKPKSLTIINDKTHKGRSIIVDDKIQISIRGIKNMNSFHLSIVDVSERNKESQSNQGKPIHVPIILLGCITTMVCCFLTFVTLLSMGISKKRKQSNDIPISQIEITPEPHEGTQCSTDRTDDRKTSASSCISTAVLLIQTGQEKELKKYPRCNCTVIFCPDCVKNVSKPYGSIQNRSINIEYDIQICKVIFVFLFNATFLLGVKITPTKIIQKVICTLLTYFGSAVYSWSLVEVGMVIYIGKGYNQAKRLFIYLIALMPPLFWSVLPCSLTAETSNYCWISWNYMNGWIAMSFIFFMFLSLISISIYLCLYEYIQKVSERTIYFKRSNICLPLVFSILFTLSVLLLVSSITWPDVKTFQCLFAGSNSTLGIYILFSAGLARKEITAPLISALLYMVEKICPNKKGDRNSSLAERMKNRFWKDEKELEDETKINDSEDETTIIRDIRLKTLAEETDLQLSGSPTFISKSLQSLYDVDKYETCGFTRRNQPLNISPLVDVHPHDSPCLFPSIPSRY